MMSMKAVMAYIFGPGVEEGATPDASLRAKEVQLALADAKTERAIHRQIDEHYEKVDAWIAEQKAAGLFPKPRLVRHLWAHPKGGSFSYSWKCSTEYGVNRDVISCHHRDHRGAYVEWSYKYAETIMRLKGLLPPKVTQRYTWSDGTPSRGGY